MPELTSSPFLNIIHTTAIDIMKFCLGFHHFPIETGWWTNTRKNKRLCRACGGLGDERHVIYECSLINREGVNLNDSLNNLWYQPDIFKTFKHIKAATVILLL